MERSSKDKENDKNLHIQEHHQNFKLFSYLSVTIMTIAVIVGLYLVLQHMNTEDAEKTNLANQEDFLTNQKLIIALSNNQTISQNLTKTILEKTRHDNAVFFEILSNMTKEHDESTDKIMTQAIEIANESNTELDQILKQGVKIDKDADKKIDKIMKKLKIPIHDHKLDNRTLE
ncbi:MAG: hypothetical protein ACXWFZ_13420 [Nitrososphaeraceae archaeon]